MRVAIVAGRFNEHITKPLLDGALDTLRDARARRRAGVLGAGRVRDPAGRASAWRASGTCDAVVCLGAVIRGDTPHFDYVAGECAAGITRRSRSPPASRSCSACSPPTTSTRRSTAHGRRSDGQQGEEAARHRGRDGQPAPSDSIHSKEAPDAAPRPPQGLARSADPPAVRRRRPRGVARLRRRLPRHASTTRASTTCASSARRRSRSTWPTACFDVGITGRDWIEERNADVVTLTELHYSKATARPIRMVLAVAADSAAQRSRTCRPASSCTPSTPS